MVTSLIIDNDKSAVDFIKTVGKEFTKIVFKDVVEKQSEAINAVLKNNADLVIINLDSIKINIAEFMVEMYNCKKNIPTLIALSSSKEKAYDAYRYNFSDFILKPLTELSIRQSLLKFQMKRVVEPSKTICLKSNKDYRYLDIDKILFLKADNNTTDFYMTDGTVIGAYKTLKTFENTLPKNFLRIHKSYIINRNCISRIHYGKALCVIKNNLHKIPFTKTFIDNIDTINNTLFKNTVITLN